MKNAIRQVVGDHGQIIKMEVRDSERGARGEQGEPGEAATISIGSTTTLPAGSQATVMNAGTTSDAVLVFGIPKGDTGADGKAATITVGSTDTLPAGHNAIVTNTGDSTNAVLNFKIPQGVRGVQGPQGPQGVQGEPGKDGADGADGAIHYTAGTGITISGDNVISATGAAVATWGGIQGNISNQTDLQNALNALSGEIPTATSQLTNDSNFVSDAAYVHTDNNYTTTEKTKLASVASGAEANVQANWAESDMKSDAYIQNKPTLAAVAISGSYNDLSNKPTIPMANDATLTIQNNGTTVGTFTANSSTDTAIDIAAPVITMTTTDPGEGAALVANHFIAVYEV